MNCRLSLAVSAVSSFGRGRDADCSARRVGPGSFTPSLPQIRT